MRTAFIQTLVNLAKADERIFLIVADLGYSVVESFIKEFPKRFINVGVAEQNMTGIATGLALSGKIVFTYSIANFPTLRCFEQIRNDVCYHNANVKIVSVGGGLAYGALGMTHHGTEDIAIMRALPNMTVVVPGDPIESALSTEAIIRCNGPCYLRLGKAGEPHIHRITPNFQLGKAITVRNGNDITLIATGGILYNALQSASILAQQGIQARVVSMHTIKPLDTEVVAAAAQETNAIITIEEHSIIGGLGGAVAENLSEMYRSNVILKRLGITDSFCSQVGDQEYLRELYSISVDGIVSSVISLMKQLKRLR